MAPEQVTELRELASKPKLQIEQIGDSKTGSKVNLADAGGMFGA